MGRIIPIEKECMGIVDSKMIAYARADEEYFTLISKDAFLALNKGM
jgi:hypothetical protein